VIDKASSFAKGGIKAGSNQIIMADLEVPTQKPLVYKHIGLYGHAVGTFTSEFYWLA
jgi:hypothetical protein